MPKASVKVMRSHDYCHFEVSLSSDQDMTLKQIDDMRKDAARLVDHAVEQYKKAKEWANKEFNWNRAALLTRESETRKKPVSEWTPEDKAIIKAVSDGCHYLSFDYDEDEW